MATETASPKRSVNIVTFNVGGKLFSTTVSTITKAGTDNLLAKLVEYHQSGEMVAFDASGMAV